MNRYDISDCSFLMRVCQLIPLSAGFLCMSAPQGTKRGGVRKYSPFSSNKVTDHACHPTGFGLELLLESARAWAFHVSKRDVLLSVERASTKGELSLCFSLVEIYVPIDRCMYFVRIYSMYKE